MTPYDKAIADIKRGFTNRLTAKLKYTLTGSVSVYFKQNGDCVVEIEPLSEPLVCVYICDALDKVIAGSTVDDFARLVINKFKVTIFNRHFKKRVLDNTQPL